MQKEKLIIKIIINYNEGGFQMVEVGKAIPDFSLLASNGETISLKDFGEKNIVLYFYPKDNTPGCTNEALDFKQYLAEFAKLNTVIIGISPDSLASHEKFISKHALPFVLLSDEKKQVAELFDVYKLKKNYGKEYLGIVRSTFLIDKNGILVKEWRNVKVKGHVEEVLNFLKDNLLNK